MPQALIRINAVIGSNTDLPLNTLVQFDNANIGSEVSYAWKIIDQPVGPVDALSSLVAPNPTLTPRKEGSYLIQLIVNGDVLVTNRVVAAVRFIKNHERAPAANEQGDVSTTQGWMPALNALVTELIDRSSNPMALMGNAATVGLSRFTRIGQITGVALIRTGLPTQESIPNFSLATGAADLTDIQLFMSLGGVDGSAVPALNSKIRMLAFGIVTGLPAGVNPGDPLYIADDGSISKTPGTIIRRVGIQMATGAGGLIYFDGRSYENALQMENSNAPASAVGFGRLTFKANRFVISENAGAYAPLIATGGNAPKTSPYLTDGADADLTNERNIQALLATLTFIMGAVGPRIAIRSFAGNNAQALLELRDSGGAVQASINGLGQASLEGGNWVYSSGLMDGTNNTDTQGFLAPTVASSLTTKAYVDALTKIKQMLFIEQTVDTSTVSAVFVTLLTQAITTVAGTVLDVTATLGFINGTNNAQTFFRITIDAVAQRGVAEHHSPASAQRSAAITVRKTGLAAGVHTVLVEWRVSSGTASIRPATQPDQEHASLRVIEGLP